MIDFFTILGICFLYKAANLTLESYLTVETTPVKKVDKKLFNEIKRSFRPYFEGSPAFDEWDDGHPPLSGETPIRVDMFGIHLLELEEKTLTIHLSRPGIFIGKGGRTITAFSEFLQKEIDSEIKIEIREFDPFKCERND